MDKLIGLSKNDYNLDMKNIHYYLHHRKPYLLIDKILDLSQNKVVTSINLTNNHFVFNGHFPGAPVMPGAMMQELMTQSAGIIIADQYNPMKDDFNTEDPFHNKYALGVLRSVKKAKYFSFAKPGDSLTSNVELTSKNDDLFSFKAKLVNQNHQKIAYIEFNLCNTLSENLYS